MSKHIKELIIGSILGLFIPFAALFVYWLFTWTQMGFIPDFFKFLHERRMVAAHLSLACILNLPVFYFLINREKFKTAQGIILGTLLYAIYIFYYKLVISGE
jgi:hypothetical protein